MDRTSRGIRDFAFSAGDSVVAGGPHDGWGVKCTVVEQITPFQYPKGAFTPSSLLYLPRVRKWGTTTRKLSYLVRVNETDLHIWATKDCVRKE